MTTQEYIKNYQEHLSDMMEDLFRIQGRIDAGVYKSASDIPASLQRQVRNSAEVVERYIANARWA